MSILSTYLLFSQVHLWIEFTALDTSLQSDCILEKKGYFRRFKNMSLFVNIFANFKAT